MAADEEEITLADVFAILRRRRWTVGGITLFFVLLGVLVTWLPAPVYQASSALLFPAGGTSSLLGLAQSLGLSVPAGGTAPLKMYRAVLESQRLRQRISEQTGIPLKKLESMVSIKDDLQASLISINVRHTDAKTAQRVARLYITTLAELNREMNLPLVRNQVRFLENELALRTKS